MLSNSVSQERESSAVEHTELDPQVLFDPTFLLGLRQEIGDTSFCRLLNTCIDDIDFRLGLLTDKTADTATLRAIAHQLLGIFGHVGATGAVHAARDVLDRNVDDIRAKAYSLNVVGGQSLDILRSIRDFQDVSPTRTARA